MHIVRYLFQHKLALLAVVLLFGLQAIFDLALPAYTSDMVDVGIQQGGVPDAAPIALTVETYASLEGELDQAGKTLLAQSYVLEGGHYTLTDLDGATRELLSKTLVEPFIELSGQTPAVEYNLQIQQVAPLILAEYEALGMDLQAHQMSYLLRTGLMMLLMVILACIAHVCMNFFATRTGACIATDLRAKLFGAVVGFSQREVQSFSAASLITRGTNDIQLVQFSSVMLQRMVTYSVLVAIGGVICVARTNVSMTWTIVLAVLAVIGCMSVLVSITMPKFKLMQKMVDRVNLVARESILGVSVIRAFNREAHEERRFAEANKNLMDTQLFTGRAMSLMSPFLMLIMNGVSVLIVWVGAQYVDLGTIQTGDLIAFITYSMTIIQSFLMLGMVAIMLPRAEVAAVRVDEVIATKSTILDPTNPQDEAFEKSLQGREGVSLEFRDVSFAYDDILPQAEESKPSKRKGAKQEVAAQSGDTDADGNYGDAERARGYSQELVGDLAESQLSKASQTEQVLHKVSFAVEPGQTCAIVGGTGAGKSTLLKLLLRFYDVQEGSILVNGFDVRNITQASLRKALAYVPQTAFLFEGDVTSNVLYGAEAAQDEEVLKALQLAQAKDFVLAKEDGLKAEVSSGGTNFSGGQRQRLSIARALATKAHGYLFDDSFSALDYKTDLALRTALATELSGPTKVIVAQRIATVAHADVIVVLDEGQVVGAGTHQELMHSCKTYQEIALSQLSEEELEGGIG